MVRSLQLRAGRDLCIWMIALLQLVGPVAKRLTDLVHLLWLCRDFTAWWCENTPNYPALKACMNVHAWACPAHGSRVCLPSARPVGLKSLGARARAW